MAALPEVEAAPESVPLRFQDSQICLDRLDAGILLWHVGHAMVRRGQRPLLEGEELRINLYPMLGFVWMGSLRILSLQ